jgi:hypothetical protein
MNCVATPEIRANQLRRQVKLGHTGATIHKAKQPGTKTGTATREHVPLIPAQAGFQIFLFLAPGSPLSGDEWN